MAASKKTSKSSKKDEGIEPKKSTAKKAATKKTSAKKTTKKAASKKAEPKKTAAKKTTKKTATKSSSNTETKSTAKKTTKKATKKTTKKTASKKATVKKKATEKEMRVIEIDPIDQVREIPERYNETRLVIMVRDPQWCFAYWDISDHDREQHNVDEKSLHVRIYRLLAPENVEHKFEHLDIEVGHHFGSWYIMLGMPNQYYVGELGYYNEDGSFVVLSRSSIIYAPRDTYSDLYDDEWLIPEELERILYGEVDPAEVLSSASVLHVFRTHMFEGFFAGGASSSDLAASSSDLIR